MLEGDRRAPTAWRDSALELEARLLGPAIARLLHCDERRHIERSASACWRQVTQPVAPAVANAAGTVERHQSSSGSQPSKSARLDHRLIVLTRLEGVACQELAKRSGLPLARLYQRRLRAEAGIATGR